MPASISEEHGLDFMSDTDLVVYSVGISTAGEAEIRMAKMNSNRKIVATTIDEEGLTETVELIDKKGFKNQIICKLEDVSEKLPYADGSFYYVYARLVLHYLPKQLLHSTLLELHRILNKNGKIYVVVRSTECPDFKREGSKIEEETGFTYYTSPNSGKVSKRYFHTEKSISEYLNNAGFEILRVESYGEQLYSGYHRKTPSKNIDYLIEVKAIKA